MGYLLPERVTSGKCTLEYDQNVQCQRDECLSALIWSIQLHRPASKRPMKQVRGLGCGQGYRAGRRALPILKASVNVCVVVNLETGWGDFTSELTALPAREKEATWLPGFMSYVGLACGCC